MAMIDAAPGWWQASDACIAAGREPGAQRIRRSRGEQQLECPVQPDRHLHGKSREADGDRSRAGGSEVDQRLEDPAAEQQVGEGIRDRAAVGDERNEQQPAEDRQTLHAVAMSPRKPLHDGRQARIVGREAIRSDLVPHDQLRVDDFHQQQEKQRTSDGPTWPKPVRLKAVNPLVCNVLGAEEKMWMSSAAGQRLLCFNDSPQS